MLTKGLDQETEKFLSDILAREKTTTDELIKNLIRDRWLALNQSAGQSAGVSEEQIHASREAMPTNLMPQASTDATSSSSNSAAKQKNNKKAIAEFIKKKRFC
jgi:hypothetical protein